jgi:oxygen-dependent protoporphyrinogen oxidase
VSGLTPLVDDAEVAVVGGGIAGLTAAWRLRDRRVIVLEAEPEVGGRIRSLPRGEYWLNLAAHVFPPPETALGRVIAEIGLETTPIPGNAMGVAAGGRVLASGRPETYPLRLPLSLQGRLSFARAGLRIRRGVREYLAATTARPGETPAERRTRLTSFRNDETFAGYLGPLAPEADAIIRAAVNRVAAEPEQVSAGAGIAQFAATFSGNSSIYHRNLAGGSSRLPQALAAALGDRIVTGATVRTVEQSADGVAVEVERDGRIERVSARAAVVATTAFAAARIVDGLPQPTREALESIPYGPYSVLALLTKERQPMPWDDLYAVVAAGRSFNMLFNTASVLRGSGQRRPGGTLMLYGASRLARNLADLTDSELEQRFLRDLDALFPGSSRVVEEAVVHRWTHGIPHTRPGRAAQQAALEAPLGRIALAGDYLADRGGMDTAAESAVEAAATVRRVLEAA